jgi:hypothetical protein
MRQPVVKAASLAAVLAVAACAYPNPQHVAELNTLVGKPEQTLIQTYGVPNRTYDTGGHRYLAYSRSRIVTLPGAPGFGPWGGGYYGGWGGWGGWGGGWGGFPPEIVQRDCETTFDLLNGVVQSWKLRGNAC